VRWNEGQAPSPDLKHNALHLPSGPHP
jgi:hypothetical protein